MTPCQKDPSGWDTHLVINETAIKANRSAIESAQRACMGGPGLRACPALRACQKLDPIPESVLAGVVYDSRGKPTTLDNFYRTATTQSTLCLDQSGTLTGYRIHRKHGEPPCDPCRLMYNAAKRAKDKPTCVNGHRYRPETTRINKGGRRICLICRPECRPKRVDSRLTKRQKRAAQRQGPYCRRGHKWSDVARINSRGVRFCGECKRQHDRSSYQRRNQGGQVAA